MNRRRTTPGAHDLVWLSGWVFADLLLGLAVIFLAGTRGSSALEIAALTPSLTFTPGPSPTAYPTYTPGPSPTAYPTYTPPAAPTAYPTYTPGPSPTPYPTYTRGPSPTPFPTWTPPAAPTAYPTYTPGPSPTAYPTYTPGPTATPYPTYTPGPPTSAGLDPVPYLVSLRTDPSLFLSANVNDKTASDNQLRLQINYCLGTLTTARGGLVLGTGYNPDVSNGHNLAKRAMAMLREINQVAFSADRTVQRDFHSLTDDPLLNGVVTLEIYFATGGGAVVPKNLTGKTCLPPPQTWCQGPDNPNSLIVYNWDVFPSLQFTLDNRTYTIKNAKGTNPTGDDRTVGCIMVSAGTHTWRADQTTGTLTVSANTNPNPIRLCNSPAQLCLGGQGPMTPAPGVR